jgi:hypothetical protein
MAAIAQAAASQHLSDQWPDGEQPAEALRYAADGTRMIHAG